MIDLKAFRQHAHHLHRVDRVVGGVVLQAGLHDAGSVELVLTRNNQFLRHHRDLQATVVGETSDGDKRIFQAGFRQIGLRGRGVGKRTTVGQRVRSGEESRTVANDLQGGRKALVQHVGNNQLTGLGLREGVSLRTGHRHRFVLVVLQFFHRHRITQRIGHMGCTGDVTLHVGIHRNASALGFCRGNCKPGVLYDFFVVLVRSLDV